MSRYSILGVGGLATCLLACSSAETRTPAESMSAAMAPAATGSSVPTATQPDTAAESSARARTPAPVNIDLAAARARLPKNAAMVGWFRPNALDVAAGWSGEGKTLPLWIAKFAPTRSVSEVMTKLGIDPNEPIAMALHTPDLERASQALDAAVSGNPGLPPKDTSPPDGVGLRLVAKAVPGVDVGARVRELGDAVGAKVLACPADAGCAKLGEAKPVAVIAREGVAIAIFAGDGRLELEIAGAASSDELGPLLAAIAEHRKQPLGFAEDRCQALRPEAALSVCVDADRSAILGAATGLATAASALRAAPDPKTKQELGAQGRKESMRNLELAKPEKILVDDGTITLDVHPKGYDLVGSWRPTDPAVLAKLASPRCSDTPDLPTGFSAALFELFPERGSDFGDVQQRVEHLREAGFGGYLVLFARTWPNFVGATRGSQRPRLALPGTGKACLAASGQRLELRVEGKPFPMIQL